MSAFGDAVTGLKNVMPMQERIDGLRGDIPRIAEDLRTLPETVHDHNARVLRIEPMIEMPRGAGAAVLRIDG